MTYDGFISYSHAADGKLAPALQSALQRFAKPWYRRRALHIFRDQTSLAATPELWPTIQTALDDARYFLLLASPEAAQSKWVRREVGHWLATKPPGRLFIVLTGGELVWDEATGDFDWTTTTALPEKLKDAFPSEPLWVDLRWARGEEQLSLKHPRFLEAVGDLAAPLRGQAKEDLLGEEVRQHRRAVRLAVGAIVALTLLLLVALVGAGIALDQRARAESASQTALARQLAAQAANARTGSLDTRLLLSLEANRLNPGAADAQGGLLDLLAEGADLEGFIPGLHQRVDAIAFRHDGAVFATSGPDGISIWDPQTRKLVAGPFGSSRGTRQPVAFSPDGAVLASSWQDGLVSLFDGTTFAPIGELRFEHPARFVTLAFSPDGAALAAAGMWKDGGVLTQDALVLWDWEAGKLLHVLDSSYAADVNAIAFSPDGQTLVSGGETGRISVWDWRSGGEMKSFVPIAWRISALAFSPDGRTLAVGGLDRRVHLWDATEWTPRRELIRPNDRFTNDPPVIRDLAFSPDGRSVVAASEDGFVYRWILSSAQLVGESLDGHGAPVISVIFSPDGTRLVSGAANGTLMIRSVAPDLWQTRRFNASKDDIFSIALTTDGRTLAAGDTTGQIHFWAAPGGESLGDGIDASWTTIYSLAFSADGRLLASGDNAGNVALWDVGSWDPIHNEMGGHRGWVNALIFLNKDQVVASSSGDGTVRFWDVATGEPLGDALAISDEDLTSLAVSQDERWLAVGTSTGVALIDVATRRQSGDILPGPAGGGEVTMVAFSPDGTRLAAGGWGGAVLIDMASRQQVGALYLPQGGYSAAVAFSPDGSVLATGGSDGLIRLWDVATLQVMGQLPRVQQGFIIWLFFTSDGRYLISNDFEGDVVSMDMDAATWMTRACAIAARNLSREEWSQFFGEESYHTTCPNVPSVDGFLLPLVPAAATPVMTPV
jgi:WD40 repeat protein